MISNISVGTKVRLTEKYLTSNSMTSIAFATTNKEVCILVSKDILSELDFTYLGNGWIGAFHCDKKNNKGTTYIINNLFSSNDYVVVDDTNDDEYAATSTWKTLLHSLPQMETEYLLNKILQ